MIFNALSTFTLVYIRLTVGVTIIHGQPCVSIIPHSERDRFKIMLAGVFETFAVCMPRSFLNGVPLVIPTHLNQRPVLKFKNP